MSTKAGIGNASSGRGAAGWYLYAVLPAGFEPKRKVGGLAGADVTLLTEGSLSAAMSLVPAGERLRPERRNLAAHNGVLKALMEDVTVLPVAFGIVATDEPALRRILSRNQETLLSQLTRVNGRIEMGLRVTWDVPNIFEYMVNVHEELRETRDRIFGVRREPTQDDKIEIGRLFERILNEERETHTDRVESVLGPVSVELKRNRIRSEREVMNLACLVERDEAALFEAAIFDAARLFDDSFTFDFNGPWAPHSFVEVVLET